jgi:hypothetical protein
MASLEYGLSHVNASRYKSARLLTHKTDSSNAQSDSWEFNR